MFPPWRELKDAEISMLEKRRVNEPAPESEWEHLRDLFEGCRHADDAEKAVCYHGVAALLAEHDGDLVLAIKHRLIEIAKIEWLHEEEQRNPTDGYQIQNYGKTDLDVRREIVEEIKADS